VLPVIVVIGGGRCHAIGRAADFKTIDLNHMGLITEVLPISTDDRRKARMSPVSRTITIIDDDTAVLDSTRFLLEIYDFEVLTYRSGLDFLAEDPDIACLIVDYQMPGMNGLDFLTQLRKRGNEVPAIMMSATVSPTLQRQAAELGIKRVLEKPLSNQELLRAIEQELQKS
jgi:two-component system, LuxR family, response regulator FixJ